MDPHPSPEQEGGPPTWDIRTIPGGGGFICCHALAMAAGHCAAGFCHQLPACRRWHRQQQRRWQGRRDRTMTATTVARKHLCRCARAHPLGMNPCNLRRHVDAICILAKAQPTIPAKAQPKVVKQLVAGADKDLITPLLECTANFPNGNMILQPHRTQPLSGNGDALQALRRQTVSLTVKPY